MKKMTAEQFILNELNRYLEVRHLSPLTPILEKPKQKQFGDFTTNLALQLAAQQQRKPREIAQDIVHFIGNQPLYLKNIEIAGPGFINFFITENSVYQQVLQILNLNQEYGRSEIGTGKKTQVEFISANPTGPLTIGHGRQAVLGDTIARLLAATGHQVIREYYYNNAGRQMRILGDSVRLRYLQLIGEQIDFPDDYYQGDYIVEIARQLVAEKGNTLHLHDQKDLSVFKEKAEHAVFADIRKTIQRLGINMDVYYNENSLYQEGKIEEVISALRERGLVAERDGAVWFLTTRLGMEQDRVIVKSSGEPTYRLPDIAYHREKFRRGFDLIVDIFGADHIATYPDVLLGIEALGYDKTKVKVLIHQFVTLMEGSAKIKMSTRKANFVTLDELMDEVGEDVTRLFFLMRHMNSHLNFDLTLAKNQSDENPVYYIQYAHARICSIIRFGEEKGITFLENSDLSLLQKPEELDLIKYLVTFPAVVEASALNFEPHRLVTYLIEAATAFHKFYTEHRVIQDDAALTQARLALCAATRIVLANGCMLLGIKAPEKM
jgi:arginyl-tRNA synthetase